LDKAHCPFEKAITSAQCRCELAERYAIAERLGVQCTSTLAVANCRTLLALVRSHSRFALKVTDTAANLPFGKELKIMIGGVLGLQHVLTAGAPADGVDNIHGLVQQAQARFGSLSDLPYQEIVKSVAAYQPRRRSR